VKPRAYQRAAVKAVHAEFARNTQATLLTCATGLGKTLMAAYIIPEFTSQGKVLFIAHRDELLEQAEQKIRAVTGQYIDREQGARWANIDGFGEFAPRIICASVQTLFAPMGNNLRVSRFNPMDFSLVILDECFVAGTMVDGKPIETLVAGDLLSSGRVVRTMRKRPSKLLRLRFASGRELVCTPNHPIFNGHNFVAAGSLQCGDMVATISSYVQHDLHRVRRELFGDLQEADVLRRLRSEAAYTSSQASPADEMCGMRSGSCGITENDAALREEGKGLLFSGVFACSSIAGELGSDGENEPEVCIGTNDRTQSDASYGRPGQGFDIAASSWVETTSSRRQREGTNRSATSVGSGVGMGNGSRGVVRKQSREWVSVLLQARHSEPSSYDRNRSRWAKPRGDGAASTGPEKRQLLEFDRLDSSAVLEPGSDGRFGGLCRDGYVYNLEVENSHVYIANGVVVHNCHHYVAKTYRRIVEYFLHGNPNLKLVGLTATPNRKDRKALSQILTTEAFRMDMRAGIDSGWLVMPHVLPLYIAGMDFSRVDASKGELNGKELAQVMEQEAPLQGVAAGMYEKSEGKQTIGFCASVDQAKAITNILNRRDAGVARFVYDKTPDDERRAIARGYRAGDFRILTNVGVYTEGADFPETGCVAMARPTLSTPLYTQMLGRSVRTLTGLLDDIDDTDEQYQLGWDGANTPAAIRKARIAASAKPHALVLDFVGNAGKHDVATAFDALAGDIDPEELAEVKRIARESKGARPVDDVFAEAKRIRREKEEEEERKRRHVVANVQFEMGKMTDVFSAGKDRGMHLGHRDTLATGKQIGFIKGLCKKHGIPRPEFDGMTKREAQKLINRILYSQAPRKSAVTDADYWFYT